MSLPYQENSHKEAFTKWSNSMRFIRKVEMTNWMKKGQEMKYSHQKKENLKYSVTKSISKLLIINQTN
ncbi:hypothetical protein H0I29_05905 [Polaribacter sp. R2A056_3_33]|jgi:hypothetical protein|uniref:hypothetical protein n=1 Tax=unclassified Polaribacter TaxID=196858 RepID=UPI001C4F7941|nr:hypothetical protein [Polaribacter sp. R2A056_3_33]QXP71615.1 hypothetical protein H0I29_05905 [Polaribacter sp. R2A056_3_33]